MCPSQHPFTRSRTEEQSGGEEVHAAPHVLPKDPLLDSVKFPARSEIHTTSCPPHRRVNTKAWWKCKEFVMVCVPWMLCARYRSSVDKSVHLQSCPTSRRSTKSPETTAYRGWRSRAAEKRRSLKKRVRAQTTDSLVFGIYFNKRTMWLVWSW